jgi:hypothetical protein
MPDHFVMALAGKPWDIRDGPGGGDVMFYVELIVAEPVN